jgi:hypothetical protein
MKHDATILPFEKRPVPAPAPEFAPGVPPFDPMNPAHVNAWNTLIQITRRYENPERQS